MPPAMGDDRATSLRKRGVSKRRIRPHALDTQVQVKKPEGSGAKRHVVDLSFGGKQTANRLDRIATLRRQKTQARGHTPPHKYEG